MNPGIDFPALVRQIREARGLTQEQLARELMVTFATVNGWENGRHQPIQALASSLLQMARDSGVLPKAIERNQDRSKIDARKGPRASRKR